MKRLFWLPLSLLLLSPAAAQQVEPETFTLENGMEFLLVPRTDEPNSIAAGWVAKVGSVNERPGITGISHFFEHMMFKGTETIGTRDIEKDKKLNAEQHAVRGKLRTHHLEGQYARWRAGEIDDPWDPKHDTDAMKALRTELKRLMAAQQESSKKSEFDEIYAGLGATQKNAFTTNDLTFYIVTVPSNKIELWAWMESDRLANPVFREFYSERDVVHEERRLRTESTPTGIYDEELESMFWQSSAYSWPVIGWPSDLNSYTYAQAKAYYDTYYQPNNLVGVLVGDFDPVAVKKLMTRYFSRLKPSKTPPPVVTMEIQQKAEKRMTAEVEAAPSVQVLYHTVPFNHPDEGALEVLAEVLNGRTGRLYRALIEKKKVATSAGVRQDSRKYAGRFGFSAECKGEVPPQAVEDAWYGELKRLQDDPVGDEELQKIKNQVLANSFRRLRSNFFLMIQLGYYEGLGGWEHINTGSKALMAVEAADIQRVAKKYFEPHNRCVAQYTRKAGTSTEPDPPEIANMPGPLKAQIKQALKEIAGSTNPEQLRMNLTALKAQAAQVPPMVKPALELLVRKAEERLAELEGKSND